MSPSPNKVFLIRGILPGRAGSHDLTAALAKKLAAMAGLDAGEVRYLPSGKPVFTGEGFLSASHSGKTLFVAVSSAPVGLDAETRRAAPDRVAKRWFSPSEQQEDFFAVWTAKEAVSKICGGGLSDALRVAVSDACASLDGESFSLWHDERDGCAICLAAPRPFTVVWAE